MATPSKYWYDKDISKNTVTYEAANLDDVANWFESKAKAVIFANKGLTPGSIRNREAQIASRTWLEAAAIIRKTVLTKSEV